MTVMRQKYIGVDPRNIVVVVFGDPRLPKAFWEKVKIASSGCWEWQAVEKTGYGRFYLSGKSWPIHRLLYTVLVFPVPDEFHVDHICRNRSCCNPLHIEPVTPAENSRRSSHHLARIKRVEKRPSALRVVKGMTADEVRTALDRFITEHPYE